VSGVQSYGRRKGDPVSRRAEPQEEAIARTKLKDHAVLVGYGRVGRHIERTEAPRRPFLVVEERQSLLDELRREGVEVIKRRVR
jgi:CPA2 family monovalent cation:H+ antiporter-2